MHIIKYYKRKLYNYLFFNFFKFKKNILKYYLKYHHGDWGLGIGDWGLGIGYLLLRILFKLVI